MAFWVRDVIRAVKQGVDATGSAVETDGVAIWAVEGDGSSEGVRFKNSDTRL
jgi:hypothetical protein